MHKYSKWDYMKELLRTDLLSHGDSPLTVNTLLKIITLAEDNKRREENHKGDKK